MKIASFCTSLCLVGVVFMLFNCFTGGATRPIVVSGLVIADGNTWTTRVTSRNLKENGDRPGFDRGNCHGDVNLEDYHPFDPSPSSKASVRPGPIQHGTPLMPYVPNPKPSPPSHSNQDGFP